MERECLNLIFTKYEYRTFSKKLKKRFTIIENSCVFYKIQIPYSFNKNKKKINFFKKTKILILKYPQQENINSKACPFSKTCLIWALQYKRRNFCIQWLSILKFFSC